MKTQSPNQPDYSSLIQMVKIVNRDDLIEAYRDHVGKVLEHRSHESRYLTPGVGIPLGNGILIQSNRCYSDDDVVKLGLTVCPAGYRYIISTYSPMSPDAWQTERQKLLSSLGERALDLLGPAEVHSGVNWPTYLTHRPPGATYRTSRITAYTWYSDQGEEISVCVSNEIPLPSRWKPNSK